MCQNIMTTATQQSLYETAIRHCCKKCLYYLKPNETKKDETNSEVRESFCCWLCLGLWQEENETTGLPGTSTSCLRRSLEERCRSYGGIGRNSRNRFSRLANQSHTVSLSGDLCLRYRWLASFSQTSSSAKPFPFSVYLQELKQHIYGRIDSIIHSDSDADGDKQREEINGQWIKDHQRVFGMEEQGSLSIHVLCLPPKDHPMNLALNVFMNNHQNGHKTKKQRKRYNKRQKCGPFITQGGDPRQNLEVRLRSKGYEWISQSTAEELSSAATGTSPFESIFLPENCESLKDSPVMMMEYHVAVFRRPIFLYGYYTKSRRDVSQSPFVVMRNKPSTSEPASISKDTTNETNSAAPTVKEAETLGVTSVEEQICGPIQDLLGVSTQNNLMPDTASGGGGGGVVYGMIKFHASGREDMDVRMLVRSESKTCHGRPFCVQIIDALNPIVSPNQLEGLVETINHRVTGKEKSIEAIESKNDSDHVDTDDGLCNTGTSFYGKNPMGVGISPDVFRPVPAAVFAGLQKDTESKTKHYGCYCWSKRVLPDGNDLTKFLFPDITFPLTIQQRTPFRVLHRRANSIRERNILHARATKIDDHHFRLELSTQAGTYVKEFVYGDFGRTIPSISSLMGCKTNLLKLDCEGIEIPAEEHF